jgi:DNA-binding transcriptional ArsR family regulator
MVNYPKPVESSSLDATFAALSDPTRRAILARLARGESTVTSLAAPFAMSLPAVSKHLRALESAGLLQRSITGRIHRCRLAAQPMHDAVAWMEQYRIFWETQFDNLAKFLSVDPTDSADATDPITGNKEKKSWPPHKKTSPSNSAAPSPQRVKKSSPPGPTRKN